MSKGYIYILLATFFFSSMEIALKLVANQFNPIEINFLRFAIGSFVLLPFVFTSLKHHPFKFTYKHLAFFALTGLLCVVLSMTFFQLAILYAPASIVAILFSCNAVFVIPMAHLFLKERMTVITLASLFFSLIGMYFIVNPEHVPNLLGVIFSLLAAATFALYGIVGQMGCHRYGFNGIILTFSSFVAGSIEMFLFMLATHIPSVAIQLTTLGLGNFSYLPFLKGITWQTLPALIYLGIFITGLGYSFYFIAMEETSASTASMVFFIKPALAPILASAILGDVITKNMVMGIILIILGSSFPLVMLGIHRYQVHHQYQ